MFSFFWFYKKSSSELLKTELERMNTNGIRCSVDLNLRNLDFMRVYSEVFFNIFDENSCYYFILLCILFFNDCNFVLEIFGNLPSTSVNTLKMGIDKNCCVTGC